MRAVVRGRRASVDEQLAGVGSLNSGDDLDQAALASTVLADETDDLARPDREVDARERDDARIPLDEPAHLDEGVVVGRTCTRRHVTRCVSECNMLGSPRWLNAAIQRIDLKDQVYETVKSPGPCRRPRPRRDVSRCRCIADELAVSRTPCASRADASRFATARRC